MSYLKKLKKLIPGVMLGVCCGTYAASDLIPQLYEQGIQHYANKKYSAAADYLGQVVDMDSSNSEARYYLIYSLSLSGRNEQALSHAQILASQKPNDPQYKTLVNQLKAEISRQAIIKQKESAAGGSSQIKKEVMFGGYQSLDKNGGSSGLVAPREDYTPRDIKPARPLTDLEKAVRLIDDEFFDEAINLLNAVLKKDPKNAEAYYNLGLIEFGRFDYKKAANYFKKAISINSKHFASHSNLADCYKNLGDYSNAEKAYKEAIKVNFDEFCLLNLADIEIKLGKISDAEKIYDKVRAKSPDSPDAMVGLALVKLNQGKSNEAMELANSALKAGNPGEANYVKAMVLIENKMYSEAYEEIGKALSISAGNPKYILARALAEVRNLDFAKGLDDANAVLAADKDNVAARLIVAEAFAATSADSEAEAQLDLIEAKGEFGEAFKLRGDLAKRNGDVEKAKSLYAKYFEKCGYRPACAYIYAEFLESVSDKSGAADICKMIIKNYPESNIAENAKDLLGRVSSIEELSSLGEAVDPANQSDNNFRPGKEKY